MWFDKPSFLCGTFDCIHFMHSCCFVSYGVGLFFLQLCLLWCYFSYKNYYLYLCCFLQLLLVKCYVRNSENVQELGEKYNNNHRVMLTNHLKKAKKKYRDNNIKRNIRMYSISMCLHCCAVHQFHFSFQLETFMRLETKKEMRNCFGLVLPIVYNKYRLLGTCRANPLLISFHLSHTHQSQFLQQKNIF